MNRSFTKIRHIQESNKLLEKRLIESEETEFPAIDDEYTLGTAIAQCYSDKRSSAETKELIKNNSKNSNYVFQLIEEIVERFLNMSEFGNIPEKLGKLFFNNKNFVRGIQEICSKYKIPYYP